MKNSYEKQKSCKNESQTGVARIQWGVCKRISEGKIQINKKYCMKVGV